MAFEKVTFTGFDGSELAARLDKPEGEIRAYALFAHCFICGKDLQAVSRISRALNDEGIALLRFDFTGLGMSGGEFANTNFTSNVLDLYKAVDFMKEEYQAPAIMLGHSLGGTATLVAASNTPEVKAVATIGSPYNTLNILKQFGQQIDEIEEKGEAEVPLAGRPFKIKKQFLDDVRNQNVEEAISNLKKPLLVMHSPIDETVNIDHARMIYQAAKHPKSFISLDQADHLLLKEKKYGIYVAKVIAAWASQYIEE